MILANVIIVDFTFSLMSEHVTYCYYCHTGKYSNMSEIVNKNLVISKRKVMLEGGVIAFTV